MPLLQTLALPRTQKYSEHGLLSSSVQSSFDQVWMRHANTDNWRHSQSRDRSCRAVHRIVADMAVLAINVDALRLVSAGWLGVALSEDQRRDLFMLPSARREKTAVPEMS